MSRKEMCELTTLCLVHDGDRYLLQDRISDDWKGYALPGGHVEPGESIVESVKREMKEETGLDIYEPKLCGIKQFPSEGGRYLVFLYETDKFSGELKSSEEGKMDWIERRELDRIKTVSDLKELITLMLDPNLGEFQYVIDDGHWRAILR